MCDQKQPEKRTKEKVQAQLDEWKVELDKLKAKASEAGSEAQVILNKHIDTLEVKIKDGTKKLANVADVTDEAWDEVKEGVESAWKTLKSAFNKDDEPEVKA